MLNEFIALTSALLGLGVCYCAILVKRLFEVMKTVYRLDHDSLFMPGFFVKFSGDGQVEEKEVLVRELKDKIYAETEIEIKEISEIRA